MEGGKEYLVTTKLVATVEPLRIEKSVLTSRLS